VFLSLDAQLYSCSLKTRIVQTQRVKLRSYLCEPVLLLGEPHGKKVLLSNPQNGYSGSKEQILTQRPGLSLAFVSVLQVEVLSDLFI